MKLKDRLDRLEENIERFRNYDKFSLLVQYTLLEEELDIFKHRINKTIEYAQDNCTLVNEDNIRALLTKD